MSALEIQRMSVEEYLAADQVSETPLEYHDGEVFPIAEASLAHCIITSNLDRRIGERLDGTPCRVANAMRVRISARRYVKPDLLVFCGQPALTVDPDPSLTNPKVIFEVLSPSTADYDYAGKFQLYRLLPSFEEYVLVAQDRPRVEVFRRVADGKWLLSTYDGVEVVALVESLGLELPLGQIYANVEFAVGVE